MADHRATITWATEVAHDEFVRGKYSREHRWAFDGGVEVAGSSSPSVVPAPWSSASAVDPEEAFVAAIASCHMLSLLYVASKAGFAAASYRDEAIGVMTKNERGVPWVSKVTLRPAIAWRGETPSNETLDELHHHAHEQCFIAQSVKTEIVVSG